MVLIHLPPGNLTGPLPETERDRVHAQIDPNRAQYHAHNRTKWKPGLPTSYRDRIRPTKALPHITDLLDIVLEMNQLDRLRTKGTGSLKPLPPLSVIEEVVILRVSGKKPRDSRMPDTLIASAP